ncbi:MAG: alpha-L-rhamnosidase-related protein [Sedimentisphaerales bacterium]
MSIGDNIDTLSHGGVDKNPNGQWIWLPDVAGYKENKNCYVYFRRKFQAQGKLEIKIAAETYYHLYVDGKLKRYGTTVSDPSYKTYDVHCIDVAEGEHVVGVLIHYLGEICAVAKKSRPALHIRICNMGMEIVSDNTWKTLPCLAYSQNLPVMMSHFGYYEVCDYSKLLDGWSDVKFDDSSWHNAGIIENAEEYWPRLIQRKIPNLQVVSRPYKNIVCSGRYFDSAPNKSADISVAVEMANKTRKVEARSIERLPISLGANGKNEFAVIDFGREVSGYIKLVFSNSANRRKVDVGYDEILDGDFPSPRRTYVHFADRFFITPGVCEVKTYSPRGFRYIIIDIEGEKDGVRLEQVEIDERRYPAEKQSTFECSDDGLNKLYDAGILTTQLCMHDTYVDCPSRERVAWMDFAIQGICSAYCMGDTRLWRHCLYLFAQDTCSTGGILNGAVKGYVPSDNDPIIQSYMMYYVISLTDYLLFTKDIDTCTDLFPVAMRQVEILEQFTNGEGLLNDDCSWPNTWKTFLDWSAMDVCGISAASNAIYIRMLKSFLKLAKWLNKSDIVNNMDCKLEKLIKNYKKTFWCGQDGLFVDAIQSDGISPVRSQLTNSLVVWAGITDQEENSSILSKITDKKKLLLRTKGDYRLKNNFKCQTGGIVQIGTPAMAYFLASGLFKNNMSSAAVRYIKDNWLPIENNGTFAEHFEYDTNTSFCHGWGSGVSVLLLRYILGVKPLSPGWEKVVILPHTDGLKWAKGNIVTSLGDIVVEWEKNQGGLKVNISKPDGMQVVSSPQDTRHHIKEINDKARIIKNVKVNKVGETVQI